MKTHPNAMFSTLHHQNHPFSHHFQLSRDSQTPDSDDTASNNNHSSLPSGGGDGSTLEVVRRPRGRPPGSKNKPKPPLLITRESDPSMTPYILEIPGGNEVVGSLSCFTRRKNNGICVLAASGSVSNVTLLQLSTSPGATVTFHGIFDILSLSATLLSQTKSCHVSNTFSISLAGPQGQVVGGFVAGSLVAAGMVFVVAATFNNPLYHRLPGGEEEEEARNTVSSGGGDEGQSQPLSGGGRDSEHGGGGIDSCEISMYSSHLGGSDVIWAPAARPLPPPPPY